MSVILSVKGKKYHLKKDKKNYDYLFDSRKIQFIIRIVLEL